MSTHIARLIVGGIVGAAGLGIVAAGPALAAPSDTTATFTRAGSSYTSPTIGSTAIDAFAAGDQIEVICFVNATHTDGTDVWLRLASTNGGGWVSRSVLDVPPLAPC